MNQISLRLPRADFELSVDLSLPAQGITALFGASGSGKTSLLRCVAGLERARNSVVRIAGETWQDDAAGLFVPTWRRSLGYVFQESSLFEHLSVRDNLNYGLQRNAKAGKQGQAALKEAIELLGIGSLLQRQPQQLSGGERQRVAIARALALQPKVLLLDEPLASLDMARRREVMPWLERLRDELRTPMLYVTHSGDEVARLADHLVVLEQGRIKSSGPVAELLHQVEHPALGFAETATLLLGEVDQLDPAWHLARVAFAGGAVWVRDTGLALGRPVRLRILARDVSLASAEPQHSSIQNQLPCVIEAIVPDSHASQRLVRLRCGNTLLQARVTARAIDALGLRASSRVWALVKSVALVE